MQGSLRPLDLMSMWQAGSSSSSSASSSASPALDEPLVRRYMFVAATWGAIADVDIGTENMRWMGSTRNLVGAAKVILQMPAYNGALYYRRLPSDAAADGASAGSVGSAAPSTAAHVCTPSRCSRCAVGMARWGGWLVEVASNVL